MNILLEASGGIGAGTAIFVIFLVVTLFGALKGLMRGFKRQTVRTITIALSIFLAVLFTAGIGAKLNESLAGQTIGDLLAGQNLSSIPENIKNLIMDIDAEAARTVAIVPVAVVALPIAFTTLFVLISAVGELLHIIICAVLGFKSSKNKAPSRFIGLIIGAVQGAAVAGILLFPIACFNNLAGGMLDSMKDGGIKEGSSVEVSYNSLNEYFGETKDNFVLNTVMKLGGEGLQKKFATVTVDGKETDARESFYTLTGVFGDLSYLEGTDLKAPTEASKSAIDGIKDKLTADSYMANVIAAFMREVAFAVDDGRLTVTLDDPYSGMLKEVLTIFETSSKDNLDGDITVFLDVYYQLADSGALSAMSEGSDALLDALTSKKENNKTVVSCIIDTLDEYTRTKPLISMISKLSVSIMTESLGLDEDAAAIYNNVKNGLSGIAEIDKSLSDEEYKAAVSTVITDTLAESEIILDTEIINEMSEYATESFKDTDALADEDIDSIILSYYDAYLNTLAPQE